MGAGTGSGGAILAIELPSVGGCTTAAGDAASAPGAAGACDDATGAGGAFVAVVAAGSSCTSRSGAGAGIMPANLPGTVLTGRDPRADGARDVLRLVSGQEWGGFRSW